MAYVRSFALLVLGLLAVAYTLYFARAILFPITLAAVLCLLLRPPVRWMARRKVPYFAASGIVLSATLAVVFFGLSQLLRPAREWFDQAPVHLARIEAKLRPVKESIDDIKAASRQVDDIANGESPGDALPVVEQPRGLASLLFDTTTNFLATVAVTIVLLYFLLASGDTYLNKIVEAIPTFRAKRSAVVLFREIEWGVSRYLFTFTLINLCLGIVEGVAMWLLGMPNPALWGVMAGSLNFIPFLGPLFGTVVVALVALAEFDSIGSAVVVPLVYVSVTTLEGNFITPSLLGKSMSLDPVGVILSLVFWGWLWGAGGVLLAVPILAAFKIACDRIEGLQPVGQFLGKESMLRTT